MMDRRKAIACGCCFLASVTLRPVNAQPGVGPFNTTELEQARASYGPGVTALFYNDLIRRLPPTMRSPLANARLEMPVDEYPSFALFAGSQSVNHLVVLPVRTILSYPAIRRRIGLLRP
jgi:hypothetical protein